MSFLRRRKEEKEGPEGPAAVLPDDANWRRWQEKGYESLREGDIPSAAEFLTQTVDRFEGDAKEFGRMYEKTASLTMALVLEKAEKGMAVPTHILADIDCETAVKRPELMPFGELMRRIMDGCEECFPKCGRTNTLVMVATAGVYAAVGYLRYSCDLRDDLIIAGRGAELAFAAADRAEGISRIKRNMSPGTSREYLRNFGGFYDTVKKNINLALAGYSDQDLDAFALGNRERGIDAIDELSHAIEEGNPISALSRLGRGRYDRERDRAIRAYIALKLPPKDGRIQRYEYERKGYRHTEITWQLRRRPTP